jgi:hypothetical protein
LKQQIITYITKIIDKKPSWHPVFFQHIQAVMSENGYSPENRMDIINFWDSVAFYDFVQSPLERTGERPTTEQWEKAKKPFEEVLQKIQPDIIPVFGAKTFEKLPILDGDEDGLCLRYGKNKERIYSWIYNTNEKPTLVIKLHHATRGFNVEHWKNIYQKTLVCYKELIPSIQSVAI